MSTELQRDLIEYLNGEVDPYDFPWLMADWNQKRAEEVDNDIDQLDDIERASFIKWLRAPEQQRLIMGEAGAEAPSYLFFTGAKALKPKSWLIHFTNESPFSSFRHGARGTELGLTVHFRDRKRNTASCPQNATGELGIYESLFGFAFDLQGRELRSRWHWDKLIRKYGKNAVIFQHDSAVQAYHPGDGEEQIIFPLCAEYNAVPIYDVNNEGGGTVATDNSEVEFATWQDIVAWAAPKKRSKKLAGLNEPSRWAPGVRVRNGSFIGLLRSKS